MAPSTTSRARVASPAPKKATTPTTPAVKPAAKKAAAPAPTASPAPAGKPADKAAGPCLKRKLAMAALVVIAAVACGVAIYYADLPWGIYKANFDYYMRTYNVEKMFEKAVAQAAAGAKQAYAQAVQKAREEPALAAGVGAGGVAAAALVVIVIKKGVIAKGVGALTSLFGKLKPKAA